MKLLWIKKIVIYQVDEIRENIRIVHTPTRERDASESVKKKY